MSPGKIERSDGSIFTIIKGRAIHEDRFNGKAAEITESFWNQDGVYMAEGKLRTHLGYGHTVALDSGLIVIPYKENLEEFQSRKEQSKIDGEITIYALNTKKINTE